MRFVPIKTAEQQAILALHRAGKALSKRVRRRRISCAVCSPNLGSCFRRESMYCYAKCLRS